MLLPAQHWGKSPRAAPVHGGICRLALSLFDYPVEVRARGAMEQKLTLSPHGQQEVN